MFRRSVAMLCMALAVMLSGQTYISLMDQAEHAHHHAHFANPLAGGVVCMTAQACGHHHDEDVAQTSHHHHGVQQASHHHDDPQDPADHQHGGDATIMFLAAQTFVLPPRPLATDRPVTAPSRFASFSPRGPDHPPKFDFETRV